MKKDIKDLSLLELEQVFKSWKKPRFHAKQIFLWIYKKMVSNFDSMSDLSFDLRQKIDNNFNLLNLEIIEEGKSPDGTGKLILKLSDENFIEAVLIPTEKRVTGCVSTQIGCKFGCKFCASGLRGFKRNLTCSEIVEEVWQLKNYSTDKKLTHIVFMGIGEPFDNYDNLLKAIRIINSEDGFNIGARRITISTCGFIPGIKRLAKEGIQIELSVSLHAAQENTRSSIMPINKRYQLKELIKTCKDYINDTNRQITFEYILIKDINSDLQSAINLSKMLKGMKCKVNLIPYNPIKEFDFKTPEDMEILSFKNYLSNAGINVTLRESRGQNIDAACGQLRLKYID